MPSYLRLPTFLVLAFAGQRALSLNDWSVPCTQGECSWDIPASSGSSGSLQMWGPSTAISDITPAAGWHITNCDPDAMEQDIQISCQTGAPDCNHLFDGGAEDTIVRLPDNCGKMPFARVAKYSILTQTLASRQTGAQAYALTLDMNFEDAEPSRGPSIFPSRA
ncbi:hypothetical protein BC834DRAFT_399162 [Gloeopeniophorella convolvens]|nr:hypothetical protein BC834DRAFT_399162 [Gloeopeniophorella convolvens]